MVVSVIIVSYNVRRLLEQCLHSVSRAIEGIDAEVFIVDNRSTDNSVPELKPKFPAFRFFSNAENAGFSKANNQALALASGRYIFFLNPDTIVPENIFTRCIPFMEAHKDAGAMGVKMINGKGRFLKESKRGFPSPAVSFWKMTGIAAIAPRSAVFARYYLGHLSEDQSHAVEALSGACMFVKKEALDSVGGFDERFFMYAEDIDLSYRIITAGYANYYYPGVVILHYKGESTVRNAAYIRQFYKAMDQFVDKHFRRGSSGLFAPALQAAIRVRSWVEQVKNGLQQTGSVKTAAGKIFVTGDKETASRITQAVKSDQPQRLAIRKEEAAIVVLCEGAGFPVSALLSYMEKHPGPSYYAHLSGSSERVSDLPA